MPPETWLALPSLFVEFSGLAYDGVGVFAGFLGRLPSGGCSFSQFLRPAHKLFDGFRLGGISGP